MIGLDTTAIVDLFKGVSDIKPILELYKEPKAITDLSYAELLFGLNQKIPQHKTEEKFYDSFFKSTITLSLDKIAIKKAAYIFWSLKRKGQEIGQFDCLIAGIFLANGITKIITRNKKHFDKIPGLQVISY